MSRYLRFWGVVLLFAVFIAACATPTPAPEPTEVLDATEAPAAEGIPDVPRNRTFVSAGWDLSGQLSAPTNFSPYGDVLGHQRNILHYTINEMPFYTNYNTGEVIPWQGESWEYNEDFTELTVNLREDVMWSDGEPFTADDFVFTINMLKENTPEMPLSSAIDEWVQEATAEDDYTVVITLNKPGPRWARDFLATGQTTRFVVVPQHIWEDQDAASFEFYDPEQGWPVGTGPYSLARTSSESMFFDRRDSWWAADAGLAEMPEPQRIVYAAATRDALPQLFINNEVDVGRALEIGQFEAAVGRNPNIISWHDSGPVWGAPDGCLFRLTFNTQNPPFDDPDVRRAINYAIDREQIAALAYEGSIPPAVAPFSSYQGVQQYTQQLQGLLDEHNLGQHDPERTAEILTDKGWTRDDEGYWVMPDDERLTITIYTQEGRPSSPVLAQQLQEAGFDAVSEILAGAGFTDAAVSGEFGVHNWVHCGSLYDPWQTLEHYHSKYSAPPGEPVSNLRAYTRYENPELDQLLDQMEQMSPSPDDPEYMDLVRQATEIYLRDLPDITLGEELWAVTFNTQYWQGYPTADDPYIAPYLPWEGFNQVIHNLEPTQ